MTKNKSLNFCRTIVLIVLLFSLLVSKSFAGKEEALKAIETNDLVKLEGELQQGFDPNTIDFFPKLPSPEIVKVLLNNELHKLAPKKLIALILMCPICYKTYTAEDQVWKEVVNKEILSKKITLIQSFLQEDESNINWLLEIAFNQAYCIEKNHLSFVDLSCGSEQEFWVRFALDRKAKFAKIKIDLLRLPSINTVQLVLKDPQNRLDQNELLKEILKASGDQYDPDKKTCSVSKEQEAARHELINLLLQNHADCNQLLQMVFSNRVNKNDYCYPLQLSNTEQVGLIKLAIKHGASFQNIKHVNVGRLSISYEIAEFVLSRNLMDPNRFLYLILGRSCCKSQTPEKEHCYEIDDELKERKKQLVMLALTKGADLNKIKYPWAKKALQKEILFFDHVQDSFLKKLAQYLRNNTQQIKLAEKLEDVEGECLGLTILFLQYNMHGRNDKFERIMQYIINYNNEKDSDPSQAQDIENFALAMDYFQNPYDYEQIPIGQADGFEKLTTMGTEILNKLKLSKKSEKKYTIAAAFTSPEQIMSLLQQIIGNQDSIAIIVSFPGHATGLFYGKSIYRFYDPDNCCGYFEDSNLLNTATTIFESNNDPTTIGFIVISDTNNEPLYPDQENLLQQTDINNAVSLIAAALQAVYTGCMRSLNFFLNQPKSILNECSNSLLAQAVANNRYLIAEYLLEKKKVDPNQLNKTEEGRKALHIVGEKRFVGMIKLLVNYGLNIGNWSPCGGRRISCL